jgi:hypothetical protein
VREHKLIYRAIRNFRIAKLIVMEGDLYNGEEVDLLLDKGLIKMEESTEINVKDDSESLSVPPAPLEPEKKSKRKKKE